MTTSPTQCTLCEEQATPYRSDGAEVGNAQLCRAHLEQAMGRKVRAWGTLQGGQLVKVR